MFIKVALKHPGNLTKRVAIRPFFITRKPNTFGNLIDEVVRTSVEAYMERDKRAEPYQPLDDEQFAGMAEVGKFAWLLPVDTKPIALSEAIIIARTAIEDGLVRVFQNEQELTNFDEAIEVNEDDIFTFVRLTMLSGRMW